MKHRVLVTGGFGFLGGRISQELAKLPNSEIVLTSRKSRQSPSWLPNCKTIQLDVCDDLSISNAVKGVHTIVHLASLNDQDSKVDLQKTFDVTTLGTMRLVDAAINSGVSKFVYQSSVHIYGRNLVGQVTEQTVPAPENIYAISHLAAEQYVAAMVVKEKISGAILRCANGFGTPTHKDVNAWHLLVNGLCQEALQNKVLKLRSSGMQRRDFITIADIARAFSHILTLENADSHSPIYNLGSSISTPVIEMANLIADLVGKSTGSRPKIEVPVIESSDQELSSEIDVSKLRSTGFMPENDYGTEILNTLKLLQS